MNDSHTVQLSDAANGGRSLFEAYCLARGFDIERHGDDYEWVCDKWSIWKSAYAATSTPLRELVRLRRRQHEASAGTTTAPLSPSLMEWQVAWWSAEAALSASDSPTEHSTK